MIRFKPISVFKGSLRWTDCVVSLAETNEMTFQMEKMDPIYNFAIVCMVTAAIMKKRGEEEEPETAGEMTVLVQ